MNRNRILTALALCVITAGAAAQVGVGVGVGVGAGANVGTGAGTDANAGVNANANANTNTEMKAATGDRRHEQRDLRANARTQAKQTVDLGRKPSKLGISGESASSIEGSANRR